MRVGMRPEDIILSAVDRGAVLTTTREHGVSQFRLDIGDVTFESFNLQTIAEELIRQATQAYIDAHSSVHAT
jgi:hypothetical protein